MIAAATCNTEPTRWKNIDHRSCERNAFRKYGLVESKERTVCSVNKLGIGRVPYVRINDRSLRVFERLSGPALSVSPLSTLLSVSLELESAKPSRRNLRYPIDFPAGMLLHRGSRGILLFN